MFPPVRLRRISGPPCLLLCHVSALNRAPSCACPSVQYFLLLYAITLLMYTLCGQFLVSLQGLGTGRALLDLRAGRQGGCMCRPC